LELFQLDFMRLRGSLVLAGLLALLQTNAWGAELSTRLSAIDANAMSGDPARIKQSIAEYEALKSQDAEVQWRLVRAYFNYYDELTDRKQEREQQWATDRGYALAVSAYAAHPQKAEVVYYYATIGLCYLDFHRMKALFVINDLLRAFEVAQKLDPLIDDAGPDRSLGILYHELPGWPVGRGDKKKALQHLEAAVKLAPTRAANRVTLAKLMAEFDRYDEGWKHIEFVRAGNFKVSSPHWHDIYMRRVEEVAAEYPQYKKPNNGR
jgi:hypothetical protein